MSRKLFARQEDMLQDIEPELVTTDVIELNEDQAELAQDILEVNNQQDTLDTSIDSLDSLETVSEVIEDTLDSNEPISETTVALVQESIRVFVSRTGANVKVSVSNESEVNSRQKLIAANEGIGETIKNVWESIKKFFKNLMSTIKNFFHKLFDKRNKLLKSMEKYITIYKKTIEKDNYVLETDKTLIVNSVMKDKNSIENYFSEISTDIDNILKENYHYYGAYEKYLKEYAVYLKKIKTGDKDAEFKEDSNMDKFLDEFELNINNIIEKYEKGDKKDFLSNDTKEIIILKSKDVREYKDIISGVYIGINLLYKDYNDYVKQPELNFNGDETYEEMEKAFAELPDADALHKQDKEDRDYKSVELGFMNSMKLWWKKSSKANRLNMEVERFVYKLVSHSFKIALPILNVPVKSN